MTSVAEHRRHLPTDGEAILNALPNPVLLVAPDGRIDRTAVATLVFEQPDELKWLEGVLWPHVGERVNSWREEMSTLEPAPRALVVEVPLLFEAGMDGVFDHTIAVVADEQVRSARAAERGHAGVESRDTRQLSQQEKAERAEYVVQNDGDLKELEDTLSGLLDNIGLSVWVRHPHEPGPAARPRGGVALPA